MADEIRLEITSTRDFGDPSVCVRFVETLRDIGPQWLPEKFGSAEPLRQDFERDGIRAVCRAWATPPRRGSAGGDLLFRTNAALSARGWVYWRRDVRHDFNSVTISVPAAKCARDCAEQLVSLGIELMGRLGGVYGYVAHSRDYEAQHLVSHSSGYRYIGQQLSDAIPGIYWANLMSPEMVSLIGEERVQACPAHHKSRADNGTWILYASELPDGYVYDETADLRKRVRLALGDDLFFNIKNPDRARRPLPFDRSGLTTDLT